MTWDSSFFYAQNKQKQEWKQEPKKNPNNNTRTNPPWTTDSVELNSVHIAVSSSVVAAKYDARSCYEQKL